MNSINPDEHRFYIYAWLTPDTNEVFYVGKGSKNRINTSYRTNKKCMDIVNKYGFNNIIKIKLSENMSEMQAYDMEKYWISYYRNNSNILTNICDSGIGSKGYYSKLSDKEKILHAEISKSFLNKHHTEETKKKMSESAKGRIVSEETRKKISESSKGRPGYFKGKHLPEETRKKMSESAKNNTNAIRKSVVIYDDSLLPIDILSSRSDTERKYQDINDVSVRTIIEYNSINAKTLQDLRLNNNNIGFMYKKDYDKLRSLSTIEMVRIIEK